MILAGKREEMLNVLRVELTRREVTAEALLRGMEGCFGQGARDAVDELIRLADHRAAAQIDYANTRSALDLRAQRRAEIALDRFVAGLHEEPYEAEDTGA